MLNNSISSNYNHLIKLRQTNTSGLPKLNKMSHKATTINFDYSCATGFALEKKAFSNEVRYF